MTSSKQVIYSESWGHFAQNGVIFKHFGTVFRELGVTKKVVFTAPSRSRKFKCYPAIDFARDGIRPCSLSAAFICMRYSQIPYTNLILKALYIGFLQGKPRGSYLLEKTSCRIFMHFKTHPEK